MTSPSTPELVPDCSSSLIKIENIPKVFKVQLNSVGSSIPIIKSFEKLFIHNKSQDCLIESCQLKEKECIDQFDQKDYLIILNEPYMVKANELVKTQKLIEFCYTCVVKDGDETIQFNYDKLFANFTNESSLPSIKPSPYFESIPND